MKDLTHYFMDAEKSPETPSKIQTNGVTNVADTPAGAIPQKRGRVKIKISQNSNEERMCDIIESRHDLVDKTPSPFTLAKSRIKSTGDTPKRAGDNLDNGSADNGSMVEMEDDSDGGNIFSPKKVEKKDENGEKKDENGEKKESSNAFQVLMTRSKPIQYLPPKPVSPEQEAEQKEAKAKLKQNKDKLTALADKKGYSKRKLAEAEEAERIEKRLETRAKVFKRIKRDEDQAPVNQNQRNSGGLHNYFR